MLKIWATPPRFRSLINDPSYWLLGHPALRVSRGETQFTAFRSGSYGLELQAHHVQGRVNHGPLVVACEGRLLTEGHIVTYPSQTREVLTHLHDRRHVGHELRDQGGY